MARPDAISKKRADGGRPQIRGAVSRAAEGHGAAGRSQGTGEHRTTNTGPVIAADGPLRTLACRRCGYGLAGLSVTDDCPECGLAVLASLSGDAGGETARAISRRAMVVALSGLSASAAIWTAALLSISQDGSWVQAARAAAAVVVALSLATAGVGARLLGGALRLTGAEARSARRAGWLLAGSGVALAASLALGPGPAGAFRLTSPAADACRALGGVLLAAGLAGSGPALLRTGVRALASGRDARRFGRVQRTTPMVLAGMVLGGSALTAAAAGASGVRGRGELAVASLDTAISGCCGLLLTIGAIALVHTARAAGARRSRRV